MAMSRDKFQSETGRGNESLVSSSALFYTVSGSQGEKQSPSYYEQLGCPSILKPSFRDLTGCTRLLVGVPSTSYRSFPLDKLNKTMGKSSTTQSKRYGRGEKYIPPIKVNAKIRHIYSHITSSPSSQYSSIATISTQTEVDVIESNSFETMSEEKVDEDVVSEKDASTSMSPPPLSPAISYPNRLFTIPSTYAGKLEDLEKITGHIVIQRFFTRADDAFGSWLEKQLGMNNKSVGVGTAEVNPDIDASGSLDTERSFLKTRDSFEPKICNISDFIRCECFRDYHEANEAKEIKLPNDPISTTSLYLSQVEQELISQCVEYEVRESRDMLSPQRELTSDFVQTDLVQTKHNETDVNEDKRLSACVLKPIEEIDVTVNEVGDEELDIRLKSLDLEWVQAEENVEVGMLDLSSQIDKVSNDKLLSVVQNALGDISDENQADLDIEDASPSQIKTLLTEQMFIFPTTKCIPDVINVSDFLNQEQSLEEESIDSQHQDFLQINDSRTCNDLLESQSKVVEYLAELDRSTSIEYPEGEKIDFDPIDQGESSGRSRKISNEGDLTSGHEKGNLLKRSVSVDSCIGTESSGEARHGVNEFSTPVDSGRTLQDDFETITQEPARHILQSQKLVDLVELESKDSWERQDSQDQEVVTIMSSKSVDESNSRSEMSSAIKQGSDGEDADQSESDSEISSLRRPTGSVRSAVVLELDEKDIEDALLVQNDDDEEENYQLDEVDQFDAIIESHEKEKRLRPVCRKRNATTQTTKSVESSVVSATTTSRSTTATSDSSYDLEFVSKSKQFVSQLSSGNNTTLVGDKRRSYLPTSSSSLNVLNMKFTMGREFESEVSIRIPAKPTAGSVSSNKGSAITGITGNPSSTGTSGGRNEKSKSSQQVRVETDSELKNLWKDVKSRMDSRVGENILAVSSAEMHVRGNRLKLIPTDPEPFVESNLPGRIEISERVNLASNEDENIKRSLKRLKKILDD